MLFTKCLDHKSGKYYYVNDETGESTWDQPPDQFISNFQSGISIHLNTNKHSSELWSEFVQYKKREAENEKNQSVRDISVSKLLIWKKAVMTAVLNKGDFSITWTSLNHVDPILFNFESKFSINLLKLRLDGTCLKCIPPDVFSNFKFLELISLASNSIETIPDNITSLSKLIELNLNNNQLSSLPLRIGFLSSLRKLKLENNKLEKLPMSFGALDKIVRLELENNQLTALPETLDHLKSCSYINVSSNFLRKIPQCLGRLTNLQIINASFNNITFIPDELTISKSLKHLLLDSNKIRLLPEKFGNLISLEELTLDHNELLRLPITFYQLKNLHILRMDGNASLVEPTSEIRMGGAQAVVNDCFRSFQDTQLRLMKAIVFATQDILVQAIEQKVTDPAHFQSNIIIQGSEDEFCAIDMNYFWITLIPKIKSIWKNDISLSSESNEHIRSYPYTPQEVDWAFDNLKDSYGLLRCNQLAMFTKCACKDATGTKKPCIPPQIGYMCQKVTTHIKMKFVRQIDKKDRIWRAYKQKYIEDAINRASSEAMDFLKSPMGNRWITQKATERTEHMLAEKEGGQLAGWKKKLSDKRKNKIISYYQKQISKWDKKLFTKLKVIDEEIGRLKLEEMNVVPGSYQEISINGLLAKKMIERVSLPEHREIRDLQLRCELDCNQVDDDIYGKLVDKDEYDFDSDASMSEPSCNDDSDQENAIRWTAYRRHLVRQAIELKEQVQMKRKHRKALLEEESDMSLADMAGAWMLEVVQTASKFKWRAVKDSIDKKLRELRHASDVATYRIRKMYLEYTGEFRDIRRELIAEMSRQYENYQKTLACRKAEKELRSADTFRQCYDGISLETAFKEWKAYFRLRRERKQIDLKQKWLEAKTKVETAMQSVYLAQYELNKWQLGQDIYSDMYFWKHVETGEVTLDQLGLHNYLPPAFTIPDIPKIIEEPVEDKTKIYDNSFQDIGSYEALLSESDRLEYDIDDNEGDPEKQNSYVDKSSNQPKESIKAMQWDSVNGITIRDISKNSNSKSLQFSYGPDSLRSTVLRDTNKAIFQENKESRVLPKIHSSLNKHIAETQEILEKSSSFQNSLKLPQVDKFDLAPITVALNEKADLEAQRIRKELRKKWESSHDVRRETYQRQRELVPRSLEDTRRMKEMKKQQLEVEAKELEIKEDDYIEHKKNQMTFWRREIMPLFFQPEQHPDYGNTVDTNVDAEDSDSSSCNKKAVISIARKKNHHEKELLKDAKKILH